MIVSHVILGAGWIAYCTLHSIFASTKFKLCAEKWLRKQYRFYRLYYTIFAFVSFAVILAYLFTIPSPRILNTGIITAVTGTIVSLSGLTIMCICIVKYFMQLSGLKGLIENRTGNKLMITGIHKFVRHPLYTGTFLFIWGLLILFPTVSVLITDIVITSYTLVGLRFEEHKLEKEFGAAYKKYKQNVPMLIPKID